MTREEAQYVLLRAFLATKELPREIEVILEKLVQLGEGDKPLA